MVGEGGFEPPKSLTTDLQSVPFGRSGTRPNIKFIKNGAGGRTRTPDLLITNQLLYQLSYTSTPFGALSSAWIIYHEISSSSRGFCKKIELLGKFFLEVYISTYTIYNYSRREPYGFGSLRLCRVKYLPVTLCAGFLQNTSLILIIPRKFNIILKKFF